MADITLWKPANVTVEVKDGTPPVDQSAQVTQLTADLQAANDKLTTYKTFADGVKTRAQARKDADTAKVEGQDDLDAAANLPT